MTLLAVSEGSGNASFGSTATVTLELLSGGNGNVLINTFPFANTDTQVSVRLAKEVACDYLASVDATIDCNSYDFIYSIQTGSTTISGPSAGAALAVLTAASLTGNHVSRSVAISGTINSGGIIGAVGGLQEKIDAASSQGIKTVLIPLGERYVANTSVSSSDLTSSTSDGSDDSNSTIADNSGSSDPNATIDSIQNNNNENNSNSNADDTINADNNSSTDDTNNSTIISDLLHSAQPKVDLVAYGKSHGVTVWEVGTLAEAISRITGRPEPMLNSTVVAPAYYSNLMENVSAELCGRAQSLLDNLSVNVDYNGSYLHVTNSTQFDENQSIVLDGSDIDLVQTMESARNLLNTSQTAAVQGYYYAAASYCYGAALNLRLVSLLNTTTAQAHNLAQNALDENDVNLSSYQTLTDLQTYMLVDERLTETRDRIADGDKLAAKNLSVLALNNYATAIERAYSAKLWSVFFSSNGQKINLDASAVADSCRLKIQEAAERQSLLGVYTNNADIGKDLLDQAQAQLDKNPVLCLFDASQAKASYDVVLSTIGLSSDVFNQTFQTKVAIAGQVINDQFKKGTFPLIGYSYYEYALSLAPTDQSAAMLYIQFALELSNLDAYLASSHGTMNVNSGSGTIDDSGVYSSQTPMQQIVAAANQSLSGFEILIIGLCLGILAGVSIAKIEQHILSRKEKSNKYVDNDGRATIDWRRMNAKKK